MYTLLNVTMGLYDL